MSSPDILLQELLCGEESRAEVAALELGQLGRAAWPALEALLEAHEADHRWWAVRTLAQSADVDGSSFLKALQDDSFEVREAAALALAAHPCAAAAPLLVQALSDEDGMVADLSANTLLTLGRLVTPLVLEAWPAGTPAARIQMMRVLAGLRDPRAIPIMLQAVEGNSALVQHWAEAGLEQLGLDMVYIKLSGK